jgi:cell division ATPase FtsA
MREPCPARAGVLTFGSAYGKIPVTGFAARRVNVRAARIFFRAGTGTGTEKQKEALSMKKLAMIAFVLALVVALAAPALAMKEKMYVRPEVLMNALTTAEEMRQGCAVLDLGAQTSTLTIHKGGEYLYNQVVPLGGYDITEAVEQLGLSLLQAERLKCIYGVASADMVKVNRTYLLTGPEGEKISVSAVELAEVISGKLAEMLTPLMEALNKESGIEVLYVTGGGAMLNGIVGYIQRMTGVKVMGGSHAAWLTADTPDEYCMPQYASLVGTLLLGAEYRKSHPQARYSGSKPLLEKIMESTLKLFTDQGEEGKKLIVEQY